MKNRILGSQGERGAERGSFITSLASHERLHLDLEFVSYSYHTNRLPLSHLCPLAIEVILMRFHNIYKFLSLVLLSSLPLLFRLALYQSPHITRGLCNSMAFHLVLYDLLEMNIFRILFLLPINICSFLIVLSLQIFDPYGSLVVYNYQMLLEILPLIILVQIGIHIPFKYLYESCYILNWHGFPFTFGGLTQNCFLMFLAFFCVLLYSL